MLHHLGVAFSCIIDEARIGVGNVQLQQLLTRLIASATAGEDDYDGE